MKLYQGSAIKKMLNSHWPQEGEKLQEGSRLEKEKAFKGHSRFPGKST